MKDEIKELLAKYWSMMADHEPEGWPAIQMKEVTALCDEIERLSPAFEIGENVGVDAESGTFEGQVVSWSEHKTIGRQYAVYAQYPHGREAMWFPEDKLYKLGG